MDKAELNMTLINNYFELFCRLSFQGKQELMSKLKKAMKKENNLDESFFSSFGSLQSDSSAQEIIEEIRNSRNFDRNIAEL